MYTPMDLHNKSLNEVEQDLRRIADEYGPCDVVFADIETHTPNDRILKVAELAETLSREFRVGPSPATISAVGSHSRGQSC